VSTATQLALLILPFKTFPGISSTVMDPLSSPYHSRRSISPHGRMQNRSPLRGERIMQGEAPVPPRRVLPFGDLPKTLRKQRASRIWTGRPGVVAHFPVNVVYQWATRKFKHRKPDSLLPGVQNSPRTAWPISRSGGAVSTVNFRGDASEIQGTESFASVGRDER
jgi:hypothetical protein